MYFDDWDPYGMSYRMSLSTGSIRAIQGGATIQFPILQVVSLATKMAGNVTKYALVFTDGQSDIKGMAMSQLSQLFSSGIIKEFSVVQLNAYTVVPNQDMLMISDIQLVEHYPSRIGGGGGSGGNSSGGIAAPPSIGSNSYGNTTNVSSSMKTPSIPPSYGTPNMYSTPYGGSSIPQHSSSSTFPSSTGNYGISPSGTSSTSVSSLAYGNTSYGVPGAMYGSTNPYATSAAAAAAGTAGNKSMMMMNNNNNMINRPIVRDDNIEQNIIPISALNPYANKWTIKARITNKSAIKTWSNAKGGGQLFSIDLIDNQSTEIRATLFNESAAKWYGVLEEGKVYLMSGGKIKLVQNKQYTHIKNNYELSFDANSDIRPCDNDQSIKGQPYKFVPISHLVNVDPNEMVDIIGVVKNASALTELAIAKQGGKLAYKRELTVIDQTNTEVRLTLWGEKAQNEGYPWNSLPIVAFRALKVSDYGGRSLGSVSTSSLVIDPPILEAKELQRWRSQFGSAIPDGISLSSIGSGSGSNGDRSGSNEPIENRKTISAIKDESLGLGEKPDFVVVKGTINYIKHDNDPWYEACPTCNKKVSQAMNGYYCEKCLKSFEQPDLRYILNCTLADNTGNAWFTIFSDEATKLLGMDANTLNAMKLQGDTDGYDAVFAKAMFQTVIAKVRVKQEQVNNESRLKNTVISISKIDYANESRLLLDAIQKY